MFLDVDLSEIEDVLDILAHPFSSTDRKKRLLLRTMSSDTRRSQALSNYLSKNCLQKLGSGKGMKINLETSKKTQHWQ